MKTINEVPEEFGGFDAQLRGIESVIEKAMQRQHGNLTLNFNFYSGAKIGQQIERTDTSNLWMSSDREMEYLQNGSKNDAEAAPHFPLNKSEDEGRQWYEYLKGNGFIPEDTPQDRWLYVMGFTSRMPEKPYPITWLKTVETARLMLRKICDNLISTNQMSVVEMYTLASQCFTKDGKPLKLAKPRKEISPDVDLIENFLPTISDL